MIKPFLFSNITDARWYNCVCAHLRVDVPTFTWVNGYILFVFFSQHSNNAKRVVTVVIDRGFWCIFNIVACCNDLYSAVSGNYRWVDGLMSLIRTFFTKILIYQNLVFIMTLFSCLVKLGIFFLWAKEYCIDDFILITLLMRRSIHSMFILTYRQCNASLFFIIMAERCCYPIFY